jgi:hypothetical protein
MDNCNFVNFVFYSYKNIIAMKIIVSMYAMSNLMPVNSLALG